MPKRADTPQSLQIGADWKSANRGPGAEPMQRTGPRSTRNTVLMARDSAAYRRTRKRLMERWRYLGTPCVRCGWPIDYSLPGTHPDGPTFDHLEPVAHTGTEEVYSDDMAGPSHLHCNSSHGGRLSRQRRRVLYI